MAAAAHTKGGYGGVPQGVGRDFNQADTGGSMLQRRARQRASAHVLRASAGSVGGAAAGMWDGGVLPNGGGYDEGGMVPGQAQVPGDSPANDTVPIVASPGEAVLPRGMVALLKALLTRKGPSNSSPSVFDAKSATDAHKQALDAALQDDKR